MKKFFSIVIAIIMAIPTFAASNCMNYQAVVNNADGTPAINTNIGMKFTIVSGTQTLFEESVTVKSDDKGYVKYAIGSNTENGLSSVDWTGSGIMLEVGIDLNGGTNYNTMYSTEIMSVPTAMFAETAIRSLETEDLIRATSHELRAMMEDMHYELQARMEDMYNLNQQDIAAMENNMLNMNSELRERMEEMYITNQADIQNLKQHIETLKIDLEDKTLLLENEIRNHRDMIDYLMNEVETLKDVITLLKSGN